jgi:transcription termination factor Rho
MNLTELKQKPITELLELAEQMGLENMARSRKQDVIFSLLKKHAKSGEEISGDGVLEILQDGFDTSPCSRSIRSTTIVRRTRRTRSCSKT